MLTVDEKPSSFAPQFDLIKSFSNVSPATEVPRYGHSNHLRTSCFWVVCPQLNLFFSPRSQTVKYGVEGLRLSAASWQINNFCPAVKAFHPIFEHRLAKTVSISKWCWVEESRVCAARGWLPKRLITNLNRFDGSHKSVLSTSFFRCKCSSIRPRRWARDDAADSHLD